MKTSDPAIARGETAGERPVRTQKFRDRQAAIVRAATLLINKKGVRGTTLMDVSAALGIVPTGVIYYFRSKEELAGACFLKAIGAYDALLDEAGAGETPVQRLRLFVRGYVALARDVALGRRDPLAVFNDVRALDDPVVNRAYVAMFKRARALIAPPQGRGEARGAVNAATHLLLSQIFWSVIWLPLCDAEDYDRAATRMLDILENGLVAVDPLWLPPGAAPAGASGVSEDVSRETFLRAATRIINEHGYLGASVDRISAHLNVTKGSFYHHNEAKDDLVVACFRRTLDVMRRAQRSAIDSCESGGGQLATASLSLVHLQVSDETPLLRTSALTSAPEAMQSALLAQFERISLTFSAMISDGIQDGSVRPVDAHIGAEMVTAMINAAAELQHWTPKMTSEARTQAYAGAMLHGLAPLVGSGGG